MWHVLPPGPSAGMLTEGADGCLVTMGHVFMGRPGCVLRGLSRVRLSSGSLIDVLRTSHGAAQYSHVVRQGHNIIIASKATA
jgi:hypothetical protein